MSALTDALKIRELREILEQNQLRASELISEIAQAEEEFLNKYGSNFSQGFVVAAQEGEVTIKEAE